MVDTEIEPTLITNNEKLINLNRQAERTKNRNWWENESGKKKSDLSE